MGHHSLPLQTRLDHRGGLALGSTPPFPPASTFARIGGSAAVARLVDGLYDRFEVDPVLRPAFGRDLTAERENVKRFFEGWLGGPGTYFDAEWRHGLEPAHGRISISRGMAERWVEHFAAAFAEAVPSAAVLEEIRPLVERLAMSLVNRGDEPRPGEQVRARCSAAVMNAFLPLVQRDDAAGLAVEAAAGPKSPGPNGPSLLLIAAVRGKARAVGELLRLGVDANAVSVLPGSEAAIHGLPMLPMAPLCGALARNRADMVELLVEHGAQYDIFTAACVGDVEAVCELLDREPGLAEARDPAGDLARITPLAHAVFAGQLEVARLLLERGAAVGPNSVRLVRAAANAGREALTDLLLDHGADATAVGPGPWVVNPAIAEKLLARGADVNREPGRWIWLSCTGNSGHKEDAALARAMLRCGADVAARHKGRTALHYAAKAGFAEVASALIEYGSDVNARSDGGKTALDEVERAGPSVDREPVRQLLLGRGARRGAEYGER